MSRFAYLVNESQRRFVWLGKAICDEGREDELRAVDYFRVGGRDEPRNHEQDLLNQVLWKFIADSAGEPLRVILDSELALLEGFVEIGGGCESSISFEDYLEGWPGA